MSAPVSPAERLRQAPGRFTLDAAMRVLQHEAGHADPARAARFQAPAHLAYQGADVLAVRPGEPPVVESGVVALTGALGVLPRGDTERVMEARRERSPSLPAFLDLLAARLAAHYVAAGAKYRLHRAAELAGLDGGADPVARGLLALAGYASAASAAQLACGAEPLLHYAAFFAAHPRSADRLAALAADWLGQAVTVDQFAGTWLPIPPEARTQLPAGPEAGAFCRLGEATVGVRAWDIHARVVLRVGPLDGAAFAALLPGGGLLERFMALARAYLGWEVGFAVNLVAAAEAVPALLLDAVAPGRLGWDTWLCGEREGPAGEPEFEVS